MGSGYQTNSAEMASVAGKIDNLAEPVHEVKTKITAPAVTDRDFGRANGDSAGAYRTGIDNLGRWLGQHEDGMHGFADKLRDSQGGYEWTESTNTGNVRKSGGQA